MAAREEGGPEVLLTLTHPRTYTARRRADTDAHVTPTAHTADVPVVRTDRGGDVTYHGPGQLVAYPVVALAHARAVRHHVEALEASVVDVARSYGVDARPATARPSGAPRTGPPRTGVWVGDDKLAAIGVRVTGRTTSHGLALNVDPDLRDFAGIVPCGIRDGGICSLASLGVDAGLTEVRERLVGALCARLGRRGVDTAPHDLGVPPPSLPSAVRAAGGAA